ncbi:hypothetical protein C3L33_07184, partial [Rhododendron williamsianum]
PHGIVVGIYLGSCVSIYVITLQIAPFDPPKKKKKKKVVIQDPADDDVDKLAEKTESLSVSDGLESTFTGLKRKKKKPASHHAICMQTDTLSGDKENVVDDLDERSFPPLLDHIGEDKEGEGIILQPQFPWEGSHRDYEYEELMGRVFNILHENNPELTRDRRRTVMGRHKFFVKSHCVKDLIVLDIFTLMHRQPEHVKTFLLAELGTSGSIDGLQRLVVKGRFAPKILRESCGDMPCGSGRSVAPIKAGFVARVGRRKTGT